MYDALVRTSVELPTALRRRAEELARERGQSLSATLADLVARGMSQLDQPVELHVDPRSGFPVLSVGRRITGDQVAAALDDE